MERIICKERLFAGGAALLASFTLAACGDKYGSAGDKGSSTIAWCPDGYTQGTEKISGSREEVRVSLGRAVAELSSKMPRNSFGEVPTDIEVQTIREQAIIAAGVEVFHQIDKDDGREIRYLEVGTPENRIDDLSEQFCKKDNDIYLAPQAATAVGAIEAANISVFDRTDK